MSLTGSDKEKHDKLAAMWMYATQMRGVVPPVPSSSLRKIKLIPASTGESSKPIPTPPSTAMIVAAAPPLQCRTMPPPYVRPAPPLGPHYIPPLGPFIFAPRPAAGSINGLHPTYRTQRSSKSADVNSQRRRRRAAAAANCCGGGSGRGHVTANRRQRRKSEADVVDGGKKGAAFTYTGLDRLIADSFLERQEQSNAGSHMDYSSSTSSSGSECDGRQATSRASSKTKIVCRDVKM